MEYLLAIALLLGAPAILFFYMLWLCREPSENDPWPIAKDTFTNATDPYARYGTSKLGHDDWVFKQSDDQKQ